MNKRLWADVDNYIAGLLLNSDQVLDDARAASGIAGLPDLSVSPNQGKLLHLMARMMGARRILEIGTFTGYSTIWLARALPPGGQLVTLEYDTVNAEIARTHIARAGLSDVVEIIVGRALDTLPKLTGSFDFSFIDANKQSSADYFRWALELSHKGSVIVVDNVVCSGSVANPDHAGANVLGARRLFKVMSAEPRVSAIGLQTVSTKGYDGMAIALVVSD